MTLDNHVHIARRFLRSIRIDHDIGKASFLEGFVCPPSFAHVLTTMARHHEETGQSAFTWTGPYGSGKSSLVVSLSAILSGDPKLYGLAETLLGSELVHTVQGAFPAGPKGWKILPVVGRREDPVCVMGEALTHHGFSRFRETWTESLLLKEIMEIAHEERENNGGLVIFIDEMGKFLEAAALGQIDLYVFQQLAEWSSRSEGRLLIVGILHQAFEEYARDLPRESRDEWLKIQGRFLDLAVLPSSEEQIDLIAHAIINNRALKHPSKLALSIASMLHPQEENHVRLAFSLDRCWPLHPVVAYLLGSIARRRFGQNQRSIFGFLNSVEPYGFQDFLRHAQEGMLYGPDQLWDYLKTNLESSILASSDGHRWSMAAEALERCESIGCDALHLKLLKTITVLDLFKDRAKLSPSFALLRLCFPEVDEEQLKEALHALSRWSFIIFKKYLGAYAIFAGSDFDIDAAVSEALSKIGHATDLTVLNQFASLQPIVAKRHYHDTGTLRWFDIKIIPLQDLLHEAATYPSSASAIGQFLLAFPLQGESDDEIKRLCEEATRQGQSWDTVAGFSKRAKSFLPLLRELIALEYVRTHYAELAGDSVARREIQTRMATLQTQTEIELRKVLDDAIWFCSHDTPKKYRYAELNFLASKLADYRFNQCPKIHNELLNRQKPSSSAVAAQNALLKKMVLAAGKRRLGIEGFPAEGGLYASMLEATGLYQLKEEGWSFSWPDLSDPCRLRPIWETAKTHIKAHAAQTIPVTAIYQLWRSAPFGVKDGLMPVLMVAFILAERHQIVVYRDGVFQSQFTDLDVDYLVKDPASIELRWMELSSASRFLLSSMADIVRQFDQQNALMLLLPLDVARGLVGIYERLPTWTKRTMRLSNTALRVRDLLKNAKDPNQFLFSDIPVSMGASLECVNEQDCKRMAQEFHAGIQELVDAYPAMLQRLCEMTLAELQVPNLSTSALQELQERAMNIRQVSGDFRLEAWIGRLSQFDGSLASIEGLASLAITKPPQTWVDSDIDRATLNLVDMAQQFVRLETFARIKGRPEKRHAMAIILGRAGHGMPVVEEFDLADTDRHAVDALVNGMKAVLGQMPMAKKNIILAALAELGAQTINKQSAFDAQQAEVN